MNAPIVTLQRFEVVHRDGRVERLSAPSLEVARQMVERRAAKAGATTVVDVRPCVQCGGER